MNSFQQLMSLLADPNIVFILLVAGILLLQLELLHPGIWVPGFVGVLCLGFAVYGLGILPVNWLGLIFIVGAFVLLFADIYTPTHGALTAAGVAAFIVGSIVLFPAPADSTAKRVSVPLVVGVGFGMGATFATILAFALRSRAFPLQTGSQRLVGKQGIATTDIAPAGQVQVESELWSADLTTGASAVHAGQSIEVVAVHGLRLEVRGA